MKLAPAVRRHIPEDHRKGALRYVRKAFNTYRRDARRPVANQLTVSAQRKQLRKIIDHASKLSACLESLTAEVSIHLSPRMGDPFAHEYSESLGRLKAHAQHAWKHLANADRSNPKDRARHDLLVHLCIAWSRAFPKQHGVSRRGDLDQYSGPLLDFVQHLFEIEGIKHTRNALGKRLDKLDLPWRKKPLAS